MVKFKFVFISIILYGIIFLTGCEDETNGENGSLKGSISIGPICPVERDPPDPGCLPTVETYKAYPVYVWTANKSRKIAKIEPELDGSFDMELPPGNYTVDLSEEQKMIGSSNLPQKIAIEPHETVSISIEIDTGIR